ncbi:retrovirus-related Pol polyprotein from transposon opus [Trichonephila clavipes]|nr:retrovirus-related Pol polyprotein from transposon opus [Trichonephila clavipes]
MDCSTLASPYGCRELSTYKSTIAQCSLLGCTSCMGKIDDWKRVAWSDESGFRLLYVDGKLRIWRQTDEAYYPVHQVGTVQGHGGSIMVYADLEKAGIISKSNSLYNTPALFVKQKEKWRLVLDFRKLNETTLTQDFIIPTLDDILHEISGSKYFSALDMKSTFNQIPLRFADRNKTAFSTPDGDKYEFNRLCFGLKNSPKAFQSIAKEALWEIYYTTELWFI